MPFPENPQEFIAQMESARSKIDPNQKFWLASPLGGDTQISGAELIEMANVFGNLVAAKESGDKAKMSAADIAFQKMMEKT